MYPSLIQFDTRDFERTKHLEFERMMRDARVLPREKRRRRLHQTWRRTFRPRALRRA